MLYLKATRAFDRAYQDPASARRATIFGQAVIEALEGLEPSYIPYDQSTDPWRLVFNNLESFVSQRVRDVLQGLGSTKPQTVVKGGEADGDHVVLVAERAPVVVTGAVPEGFKINASEPGIVAMSDPSTVMQSVEYRSDLLLNTFDKEERTSRRDSPRKVIDLANRRIMAPRLKSSAATNAWLSMIAIKDARSGRAVDPSALVLDAARLSKDRSLLWLDVSVSPGLDAPLWLSLNRHDAVENPDSASMGIVLPRDEMSQYAVRLEIGFEFDAADGTPLPASLTGRLGPPGKTSFDIWHILWKAQRDALLLNNAEGGRRLEEALEAGLVQVVESKQNSPLAAAIAGSALIQSDPLPISIGQVRLHAGSAS
jgi:hypothetical protein